MTNRFGFDLYPKEVRWAAAEGVSEDVIAAVLLLHDRSTVSDRGTTCRDVPLYARAGGSSIASEVR